MTNARTTAPILGLTTLMLLALAMGCGTSTPVSPTTPPTVKTTTPPVIKSITAPTARVETEQNVTITAVVEDKETPLNNLSYLWTANAGTITGTGPVVTWRHPAGLKAGVDVVITLTVVDKHKEVENNVIVEREYRVVAQAAPFRVHDSVAEVKELARKFLVDLFGNTSVAPQACLVDFADVCAQGRSDELADIIEHRKLVVLTSAQVMNQRAQFAGPNAGTVHSAMLYTGRTPPTSLRISSDCHDFAITVVYVGNRWWICESTHNPDDHSFCPATSATSELAKAFRVMRKPIK
ncbi:MAG TPA: hypothetical protein VMZ90_07630 [Vicinamibacterales bacterium]|nr:hypothetical protein [Vicinamibacterales bacterium]